MNQEERQKGWKGERGRGRGELAGTFKIKQRVTGIKGILIHISMVSQWSTGKYSEKVILHIFKGEIIFIIYCYEVEILLCQCSVFFFQALHTHLVIFSYWKLHFCPLEKSIVLYNAIGPAQIYRSKCLKFLL